MWLFLSLLAAVFWGVGQIIIKKGYNNLSPLFNNILAAVIIFILTVPLSLLNGINFSLIPSILPLAIIIAILFLSYYYIIGIGQVSFTGTVIGTYPALTILLSFLFLHENPSNYQKLAALIILVGITLIALPNDAREFKKLKIGIWFWWAIFGAITVGFGDFFIKVAINNSDVYTYLFTYAICLPIVSGISIFFDKKGRKLPSFSLNKYLPTLVGVTMMELGFVSFHFALSQGLLSLVTPISSIYVAITAILAWLLLKEKISKIQAIGIALSAIGVVLVGIS